MNDLEFHNRNLRQRRKDWDKEKSERPNIAPPNKYKEAVDRFMDSVNEFWAAFRKP